MYFVAYNIFTGNGIDKKKKNKRWNYQLQTILTLTYKQGLSVVLFDIFNNYKDNVYNM